MRLENIIAKGPFEQSSLDLISIVVIGRNEGTRLARCLQSLSFVPVSNCLCRTPASTDGSAELASSSNVHVVKLDTSLPFTAARARNEGAAYLSKKNLLKPFIQFLDGDCELSRSWLDGAVPVLLERSDVAVVCGRRREKYPGASIYNQMADIEWDTPIGDAAACGGDSLVRTSAFQQIGGFEPALMAGEELEFCARLSERDWKILRIDEEMSLHDAHMLAFKQWWFRGVRAGCALVQLSMLRSNPIRSRFIWELLRSVFWGCLLPLAIIIAFAWIAWIALFGSLLYLLQIVRIQYRFKSQGKRSWLYSSFVVLDNFPRFHGILRSLVRFDLHKGQRLVEYK